jgi:hypothetical protein
MALFLYGIVTACGGVAIVWLVGFGWRTWRDHRRARTRPAGTEEDATDRYIAERIREHDRLEALRQIAASDYRPRRHARKDP